MRLKQQFLTGLLALSLALSATALAVPKGERTVHVDYKETKLKNGLRVITVEDHSAPVIALDITYNVGSRNERQGRTGFAHLFEHMMFKGSENVGSGEHFYLVFNNGGNMNGTTNEDRTTYFEALPANQLDLALFLEADRMRSLAITKENLDNQRNAVQEERRLSLDNQAYGKSRERFNELAYDNFAYKHSVIGSMEDLNAATVDDVAGFFRTYYAPNNAVVAIVGDVDTKATLAKIEKYFGSIPRQPSPMPVDLSEREMNGERRETMQDALARVAQVNVGYRIPAATHADWPALSAAGQILGGGESSRLYQRVVKDKEICTGINSGAGARVGPALFTITCSVRPGKNIADVETAIEEEVNRMRTAAVTADELQRVRVSSRRGAVNLRESSIGRAQTLADNAAVYNDPNRINTNPEKLASVTAPDVQRVMSTYLKNSTRVVVQTLPAATPAAAPTTTR